MLLIRLRENLTRIFWKLHRYFHFTAFTAITPRGVYKEHAGAERPSANRKMQRTSCNTQISYIHLI